MKKILFFLMIATVSFAQETEKDTTYWTKKGNFTLLVNQSSFDNWQAGGQSNVSGNVGANYDFNYTKGNISWTNKVIIAYGLTQIKDQPEQKTDDRIEFTSTAGKKAGGNWYYSLFFNFKTQMDAGLDPATGIRNSQLFSPAYFQIGPGMLWKKSDNLRVNIAPATSRLILVDGRFTELASSFGVEQGKTSRFEFGAAVNGYYKFQIMENVTFENILNLYSNYVEDPQNVDLDYQLNVVMKINKYLTTNFAFQTIYDDNAFRGFQTRQVIGLGVNYTF
uniref:DUF3078 domain-containing protein n=1 Tax=Flavobacterium sp. TaxID=239 RepID=UPI004049A7AE